jgi:hypothetical protein
LAIPFTGVFANLLKPFKWLFDKTGHFWEHTASYGIGNATSIALQPLFRALEYEVNSTLQTAIPDIASVLTMYQVGTITETQYYDHLSKYGLSKDNAQKIYDSTRQRLGVGEIQTLYNRGVITLEQLKTRLAQIGVHESEFDNIVNLAGYIPSVPDFVRFAVREVFSPETAKLYGQYEDFPPEFEKYAKIAGLNPEFSKYYWAAHWDLPSYSQGVEMYHRAIITRADLANLLKSLDVMPYWRDKIIKLSETPYTRVDVRRMYQSGVLDMEEMVRSYKDLGYSDEKAQKMAEFTASDGATGTKDLTKGEILNAYDSGLITVNDVFTTLQDMGYTSQECEMLVQLSDLKRMRSYTNKLVEAFKREFLNDRMTKEDATTALNQLNLRADAIDELLYSWELDRLPKVTHPSKAELLKWYAAKFIDEKTIRAELAGMGYADKWITLYVQPPTQGKPGFPSTFDLQYGAIE